MEEHTVRILDIQPLTADVQCYRVERPAGYSFVPGQATEVAVDQDDWRTEARPFTFTSLPGAPYLEFIIKSYRDHNGVTNRIGSLSPGDRLVLHDVWGTIRFAGRGLFIAGGTGITPFAAILRDLSSRGQTRGNRLLFASKSEGDILLGEELQGLLGSDVHHLVGRLVTPDQIAPLLRPGDKVYLCGPDPMVDAVRGQLASLGVSDDRLVVED